MMMTCKNKLTGLVLSWLVAACGADDNDHADADVSPTSACGFASDRYLPYEPGMTWTYQVIDLTSGESKTKEQRLDEEEHPELGQVIVQTTQKLAGSTRSLLRVEAGRVVRFQQEDLDATGAVERVTTYEPPQIRIDETAERVQQGAMWEETYVETSVEPGGAPVSVTNVDIWEVLGTAVACESPIGSFECLRLRRSRSQGGIAVKEFLFARGIGKLREQGNARLEELTACGR